MTTNAQKRAACYRMRNALEECNDAIATLTLQADEEDADSVEPDEILAREAIEHAARLLQEAMRKRGGA